MNFDKFPSLSKRKDGELDEGGWEMAEYDELRRLSSGGRMRTRHTGPLAINGRVVSTMVKPRHQPEEARESRRSSDAAQR